MYKYKYVICNHANQELFYRQCQALEQHIPGLEKEEVLQDVDGSLIQVYFYQGCKLRVLNDATVDSLTITSEFAIDPFFE